MMSAGIIEKMPLVRDFLSSQPINKAWLFGSHSKGEENANSDVDILVQYEQADSISLLTISRIQCALQKIFNKRVDLVEEDCLLPFCNRKCVKRQNLNL